MNRHEDCVVLLEYLCASGQQSLRKMQADTGIPFSTIREYINPNVLVRKSWDDMIKMRNTSRAYDFYMSTIEKPDSSGCYINISKFGYLQHYGQILGYHVYWSTEKNRIFVHKLQDHEFWEMV